MMRFLRRRLGILPERLGPPSDVRRLGAAALLERRAALVGAQRVERGVHRDAVQPGEEVGAAVERREPLVRAYEGLLRDVIGVTVVTQDMECSGVHASLMAPDEATEGFSVSLACPVEVWILVSHLPATIRGPRIGQQHPRELWVVSRG